MAGRPPTDVGDRALDVGDDGGGDFQAEELGVTSQNAEEMRRTSQNPEVRRLLGADPLLGNALKLDPAWAFNAIRAVGNYGELFERTLGPKTPIGLERGMNRLWTDGGLMYAWPMR